MVDEKPEPEIIKRIQVCFPDGKRLSVMKVSEVTTNGSSSLIKIQASGDHIEIEHHWTPIEADMMYKCLKDTLLQKRSACHIITMNKMTKIVCFTNETNNVIKMSVSRVRNSMGEISAVIEATGPTSDFKITWTQQEAVSLIESLRFVLKNKFSFH